MHRFRLNRIGATDLRGDLFGGLTAAIVALPLALALQVNAARRLRLSPQDTA